MTSLSLKKHQTIRLSTLGAIEPRQGLVTAVAVVVLACWSASLQAAPWQALFGGIPAAADAEPAEGGTASGQPPRALDISAILGGEAAGRARSRQTLADGGDVAVATAGPLLPEQASGVAAAAAAELDAEDEDAAVCAADAEACRLALEQLRLDRLSEIDLDIRVDGVAGNDYPCECRLDGEVFVPRQFSTTTFTWKAAGYCHKPLYFEQWNFERYGHSYHWAADPFISAAHFFGTLPILPYKMGVELPWECVYPVGYYRPGNCAPWTVPAFPVSVRGMAVEAATVTGLVFLLP
jgi:hypothetical protein